MPKQTQQRFKFPPREVSPGHYLPAPIVLHGYRAEFSLAANDAMPVVRFSTAMGLPQGVFVFQANCKLEAMEAMARAIIDALDVINQGRI